MDLNLKGRSVLITGASRGIGLSIADVLAAEGCNLHIAARDQQKLDAAAERITRQHGVKVTVHKRDLSLTPEVEALGRACQDVDILVNNAGDIPTGTLEMVDSTTWRRSWDLKVFGYVDLTRIIYPRMCARKSGVVINVVGAAAKSPNPYYIAGCMANIALNMFTQCLGGDSMRNGVRVVAVNPGPTISDRHLAHVKERAERLLGDASRWPELHAKFPAGRAATVEEVARTVAFLASDQASFISGSGVRIDGGLAVSRPQA
jgi:NAD(P)-dependent dehydrogenase (short-subunit alcohol dehydrogenase family)